MDRYEKLETIGKGSFGAVYLVRSRDNSRQFALKQVKLDENSKHRTRSAVLCEAKILSQLKHPNIVAYHDSFFDETDEYLLIIQDYCDGGTLDEKIQLMAQKRQYLDEKTVMQALGCLLYEMCAQQPAFDASNLLSLFYKIVKGTYDPIPSQYSSSLSNVISQILNKVPEERPSARQVLNIDYVKRTLSEFIQVTVSSKQNNASDLTKLGLNCTTSSKQGRLRPLKGDELAKTLTRLEIEKLGQFSKCSDMTDGSSKLPKSKKDDRDFEPIKDFNASEDNSVETVGYEDDFESDDECNDDEANEYRDDFEEYISDQELDDVVSCAREMQDAHWRSSDDVTLVDDGPTDVRNLLKPLKTALQSHGNKKEHLETVHLIEELFGNSVEK